MMEGSPKHGPGVTEVCTVLPHARGMLMVGVSGKKN